MKHFMPEQPQVLMQQHLMNTPRALCYVGMGIGKTAACLSTICEMFLEGMISGVLVVAPNRVATLTWPEEVRDWKQFRWLKAVSLKTDYGRRCFINGSAHIYIINYESLDKVTKLVRARNGIPPYDLVVWDELTKAKNPSSKRINRFRDSVPQVERAWGLTGTPMPNSELDLFAQVRLIDGGERLGKVFMQYRNRFFHQADYQGYKWGVNKGARNTIEERIADITITLHSKEWVDIPEPVINDVEVPFDSELMDQYKKFERDLILELRDGGTITAANAAALVTKLLQYTSGASYDEERCVQHVHNLKLLALKKLVQAHAGEPMLVAVAYQHEQDRIRRHFPQAKFFADAKSPTAQTKLKDEWNAGKVPMLVAHPKSVGHGLNLQHGGRHLVWWTLTYSREDYEQTICRLARRGQKHQVMVHRLLVPDTVDEVVVEVLENKASNEASMLKALTMLERMRG